MLISPFEKSTNLMGMGSVLRYFIMVFINEMKAFIEIL